MKAKLRKTGEVVELRQYYCDGTAMGINGKWYHQGDISELFEYTDSKELSTRECLDILYEVEDYFWGDRSGFDKIMHAQMVFAKELRKRIAALQPNIKTQR